jgi:hypothetical protein
MSGETLSSVHSFGNSAMHFAGKLVFRLHLQDFSRMRKQDADPTSERTWHREKLVLLQLPHQHVFPSTCRRRSFKPSSSTRDEHPQSNGSTQHTMGSLTSIHDLVHPLTRDVLAERTTELGRPRS